MFGRVAAALLLVPAIASAQAQRHSDVGVWINQATYGTTSAPEPDSALQVSVKGRAGYGVSFTHFIGERFSVALSADELRGRARLAERDLQAELDAGPSRVHAFAAAAQWHFTPPWMFDAYAGGGVAYLNGGRIDVPAEATEERVAGTIPFKNAFAPMLNAGVSIQLRGRVSAGVDVKWMRYSAKLDTTPDDPFQHLRLNPLTVALGLRLRL